jgi:hypothetical protein
MSDKIVCPFCGKEHIEERGIGETSIADCLGYFSLDFRGCENYIKNTYPQDVDRKIAWAKIAFEAIHRSIFYERKLYTSVPQIDYVQVLKNIEVPTPAHQADLLIDYIGKKTRFLGVAQSVTPENFHQLQAWICGVDKRTINRLVKELGTLGLLCADNTKFLHTFSLELTTAGWNRFEELQQVNKESKQAFMAMKFDDEQKQFIKDKLKPIVKETGFDLLLLTDINSKENLIDNKLRVAIRQSRFLICDLTHCNAGAYWEAGYAEGLKLPVIYICEKKAFKAKNKTKRPHFDVNHQEIFQWDKNNEESIKDFLDNIKAKIQVMLE